MEKKKDSFFGSVTLKDRDLTFVLNIDFLHESVIENTECEVTETSCRMDFGNTIIHQGRYYVAITSWDALKSYIQKDVKENLVCELHDCFCKDHLLKVVDEFFSNKELYHNFTKCIENGDVHIVH